MSIPDRRRYFPRCSLFLETMRRILLLLPLSLLILLAPAAAQASHSQESIFQDDGLLLSGNDAKRQSTLNDLQHLGVNTIRTNLVWAFVARAPRSKNRPKNYDLTNPANYNFGPWDALVSEARARGMNVLLTPTGYIPAWASRCKGISSTAKRLCRPNPALFKQFVTAVGHHFTTVHRWSIWNEPNYAGWLTPQWAKHGRTWVPESPHLYRDLVRAASAALYATGHSHDQILMGETGPIGRNSGSYFFRSNHPADFYRDVFCLDSHGRKLHGSAARIRGCSSFKRLNVTGAAVHPYTQSAARPPSTRVGATDITLVHLNRLSTWLNRAAHQGRIRGGLPIYNTEYGFQTNPPDKYAGMSLGNQAKYLNQSDFISWRMGRLKSSSQYGLRDDNALAGFQTGLLFKSGKTKPGYGAYRLPIWPSGTHVWFQVRPLDNVSQFGPYMDPALRKAKIQYRGRTGGYHTWRTVNVTNSHGFVYVNTHIHAKYWRVLWNGYKSRVAATS